MGDPLREREEAAALPEQVADRPDFFSSGSRDVAPHAVALRTGDPGGVWTKRMVEMIDR